MYRITLQMAHGCHLEPEVKHKHDIRATLKHLMKVLNRLRGRGHGLEEGIESKIITVLANDMWHKSKDELTDGALFVRLVVPCWHT